MNILAIDPGSRYNGIAIHGNNAQYLSMELLDHKLVWQLVLNNAWDCVICEDFDAQYISRYGISTVRIIGGVEAICWHKNMPLHRPKSGDRIPYISKADALLVKIHGKKPLRDHQQSAMAHLLAWEAKNV